MLKEFGGYSGTTALLRSAIEDACDRGIEWFDFGASGDLDSVRVFKESFGARPFSYRNYSFATPRYRLIMQARRAWAAGL
jgi:lipid II:glycine glycyltransferase (peptidoglycan interpeptide bridge formation enzyme)